MWHYDVCSCLGDSQPPYYPFALFHIVIPWELATLPFPPHQFHCSRTPIQGVSWALVPDLRVTIHFSLLELSPLRLSSLPFKTSGCLTSVPTKSSMLSAVELWLPGYHQDAEPTINVSVRFDSSIAHEPGLNGHRLIESQSRALYKCGLA